MMKIEKMIKVPTGEIYIAIGEKNKPLEFLTVGDYGKDVNIKADFLGITRDIEGVPNGKPMPLTEKWVITISTQYGCNSKCKFCDVPKVGPGINCTLEDLNNQILTAIKMHPEIRHTKRLNIHYARMGEPTWNPNVIDNAKNLSELIKPYLGDSLIHPVVSTMLPKNNKNLEEYINEWVYVKNEVYKGNAGLQFSINSTDEEQRNYLFGDTSISLKEISEIGKSLPDPKGRKYTLNFALADDTIIDANALVSLFSPDRFIVKITPMHATHSCMDNNIYTTGGYTEFTPYQEVENNLKKVGFDVIVFVPSYDEDDGLITCGNAILSGSLPRCDYRIEEF